MGICKKCGKPLVISGGKCAHCGASVQKVSSSEAKTSAKTAWYKKLFLTTKGKTDYLWLTKLLRKTLISTIISLLLAVVILVIIPWPGCLISFSMLIFAIITGVFSVVIQSDEMSEYIEEDETRASKILRHVFNLVLIWGYFFFVVGVVCLFVTWWAVLIAEIISCIGLFILCALASEAIDF